jgi:hypothetical protein
MISKQGGTLCNFFGENPSEKSQRERFYFKRVNAKKPLPILRLAKAVSSSRGV